MYVKAANAVLIPYNVIMKCFYSIQSGYFNSLTFEYAAGLFPEEWKRFQGSKLFSLFM